jgi:hypothetical protein
MHIAAKLKISPGLMHQAKRLLCSPVFFTTHRVGVSESERLTEEQTDKRTDAVGAYTCICKSVNFVVCFIKHYTTKRVCGVNV